MGILKANVKSTCLHSANRIVVITVISGFDIQTRLVGHSVLHRTVLAHKPRLRAFFNKMIIERRLNCNNSHFGSPALQSKLCHPINMAAMPFFFFKL